MKELGGIVVTYLIASLGGAAYYMSKADADSSGTTTKAEYDAAVAAGNSLITSLLGPGMMIGEEILAALDMIADAEPSA